MTLESVLERINVTLEKISAQLENIKLPASVVEKEKPVRPPAMRKTTTPAPDKVETPAQEKHVETKAPEADPMFDEAPPAATEVTFTLEQVRAALTGLYNKSPEMKEKAKEIITKVGNAPTLSAILPAKFADVMKAIGEVK